jgi:hypothetical protein
MKELDGCAGVHYGIKDCIKDIYDNKWLLRTSASVNE